MASFLVELPHLSVIRVRGPQRDEYLHGQITLNTKSYNKNYARIGAHCDFKGKMWSTFFLTLYNESYHLLMPNDAAEQSLLQLKKYGVFSKVEIETLDSNWHTLGGTGEQLKQDLKGIFPELSDEHLSQCANDYGQVITFNDVNIRYLLVLSNLGYQHIKERANDYMSGEIDAWQMLEISAGIGMVNSNTIAEFIPQMFNLQALNGIDFDKGCYMGQEVIARTKFLGKNKRALYILQATGLITGKLTSGDVLEKAIGENWRRGGTIISSATVNAKTRILAVLANDTKEGDVLRLKTSLDTFSVLPLPYHFD